MAQREVELKILAEALAEAISKTFEEKGSLRLHKSSLERRDIIEYNGKMRISGLEKFNNPAIISFVNYYLSEQDQKKQNALGALIIFVLESQVISLLNKLGYPKVDEDNEEALQASCGQLCHDFGTAFKSKLAGMGYTDPVMSAPQNFRNNIPQGINFCFKEYDKFEIGFALEDQKLLVAEMTMGVIPRAR